MRSIGPMISMWCLSIAAVCGAALPAAAAEPINVMSWNVESGGATGNAVAARIAAINQIDLWGLCEVEASWAALFEQAAEDGESGDFKTVLGSTGGADRLLIIYDSSRFDLLGSQELIDININGAVRAPLVAHLRDRVNAFELTFVVNHLYRSNTAARHQQATLLNAWAAQQTRPVITCGDFNFDWAVNNGDQDHDQGYDNMIANGVFSWVRPASLIKTQDSSHNSVLDFFFVAHPPATWAMTSTIITEAGDFPDNDSTPDHRPLRLDLTIGASTLVATGPTKQQLLQRIAAMEQELAAMRSLVEQMPN